MKPVVLSRRLQAVAAMVTVGNRVCDVGCDHGFVPVYLVQQGISPAVLAMDVKQGPLSAAREHIAEHGLEDVIETRLSDGLHNYNIDESDTLICAGMGGRLIMRILSDDQDKTESFRELILQPQSEMEQFRAWLREQGYRITKENMIEEDGKFYPIMRVETNAAHKQDNVPCAYIEMCGCLKQGKSCSYMEILREYRERLNNVYNNSKCNLIEDRMLCKLLDRYGPFLLLYKDKTLAAYLRREEKIYQKILNELRAQGLSDEKRENRYEEVHILLKDCRKALEIITLKEKT